jgi:heme-degrading monooxygenase HmoA
MIQRWTITVAAGRETAFEAALAEAREVVFAAAGFRRFTVDRGINRPSTYLVQVFWETAEEEDRFTHSERFQEWATLLDPYVVGTPLVERYEPRPSLSL